MIVPHPRDRAAIVDPPERRLPRSVEVADESERTALIAMQGPEAVRGIPRRDHPVLHEGVRVGTVATGTYSPTLRRGIATAHVPARLAIPWTAMQVVTRRRTVDAEVSEMPFVFGRSLSTRDADGSVPLG